MERLSSEFEDILYENLWQLYESDNEMTDADPLSDTARQAKREHAVGVLEGIRLYNGQSFEEVFPDILETIRAALANPAVAQDDKRALVERLIQEARNWSCEAKGQRATVNEIGALLGGAPDWGPIVSGVKEIIAERDALRAENASFQAWKAEAVKLFGPLYETRKEGTPNAWHFSASFAHMEHDLWADGSNDRNFLVNGKPCTRIGVITLTDDAFFIYSAANAFASEQCDRLLATAQEGKDV